MISDSQKAALILSTENVLSEYSKIAIGEKLRPCDALFAFRILLKRMPASSEELSNLFSRVTYREFITGLLEAEEFAGQFGFMPGNHRLMTAINGFRFWFNSSDREMGAVMATGSYEKDTVQLLRKIIKPAMSCVDVGAQTGFFTCLLSDIVGQHGFVRAFEPMPRSLELLRLNVKENNLDSRVTVFPLACAEASGELYVDIASGMAVASPNGAHKFVSVTLDSAIQDRVDFCKIDVEGHEPSVIRGMRGLLNTHRPILLTEFNQYWLKQAGSSIFEYAELLKSCGYDLWNVSSELRPFDHKRNFEVLDNFNVLATPHGAQIE